MRASRPRLIQSVRSDRRRGEAFGNCCSVMGLLGKIAGWMGKREEAASEQSSTPVRAQFSSIDECACCKLPLPLRLPKAGETVGNWQCVQCGYRYVAVIDEHRHPDLLAHIRPAASDAAAAKSPTPVGDSAKQVTAFVSNIQADRERRIQKRSPIETILLVTPLDEKKRECGESFLCRTADFSSSGIRLTHTEPIEAKWLWLEHLSPHSEPIRVLVKVARLRIRDAGCEIGAQFANDSESQAFASEHESLMQPGVIDELPPSTIEAPLDPTAGQAP